MRRRGVQSTRRIRKIWTMKKKGTEKRREEEEYKERSHGFRRYRGGKLINRRSSDTHSAKIHGKSRPKSTVCRFHARYCHPRRVSVEEKSDVLRPQARIARNKRTTTSRELPRFSASENSEFLSVPPMNSTAGKKCPRGREVRGVRRRTRRRAKLHGIAFSRCTLSGPRETTTTTKRMLAKEEKRRDEAIARVTTATKTETLGRLPGGKGNAFGKRKTIFVGVSPSKDGRREISGGRARFSEREMASRGRVAERALKNATTRGGNPWPTAAVRDAFFVNVAFSIVCGPSASNMRRCFCGDSAARHETYRKLNYAK